jgi:hypothetical protein
MLAPARSRCRLGGRVVWEGGEAFSLWIRVGSEFSRFLVGRAALWGCLEMTEAEFSNLMQHDPIERPRSKTTSSV